MSGAAFLIAKCCCEGVDCPWCLGIICNTGTPNGPVKLDCRGNCTVSLNFGLNASFDADSDPVTCFDETVIPDPEPNADATFLPKERVLIGDADSCRWEYAWGNVDSEFFRNRICFDNEFGALNNEIIAANRDRWLYNQSVVVGINELITGEGLGLDPPEGVDFDDPVDQANWRLIIGYAIIRGQYTHRDTITNLDCVRLFPSPQGADGIYFFGYKYVQVSEICAGNTIIFGDTATDPPDVAPYNTFVLMGGREGTMSVSFNPDVPDNAHLATDLWPAYNVVFHVCRNAGGTYSKSVPVYRGEYPDSRTWTGSNSDGDAVLRLLRFGNSVAINDNAPDEDETLFVIGANVEGDGFDQIVIEIGDEFVVPIGRRVEIYEDEGEGFKVQVEVSETGGSPNDPPCPE